MNINRIISIIRSIKEEGMAAGGPTMNTASTAGKAGFGGSAQGFDSGPTAGYDKKLGQGLVQKRKNPIIGLGRGSRIRWMKGLEKNK